MKKLLYSLCVSFLLLAGAGCEKVIEFTGEEISALMKSANVSAGDIPETLDVIFPDGTTVVAKELKPLITEPRAMLKYDHMNNRIDVIRNGKKYSITGKSVR